jgi:hypothetical protein
MLGTRKPAIFLLILVLVDVVVMSESRKEYTAKLNRYRILKSRNQLPDKYIRDMLNKAKFKYGKRDIRPNGKDYYRRFFDMEGDSIE